MKPNQSKPKHSSRHQGSLMDKQVLNLLQDSYRDKIASQLPKTLDPFGHLKLELSFDISLILDTDPGLGSWIFNNFSKFSKLVQNKCVEVIRGLYEDKGRLLPSFLVSDYIYFLPKIEKFPGVEKPFIDYNYKAHIVSTHSGRLIMLKNALVIRVYPSDLFLWRQTYSSTCACEGSQFTFRTYNLLQMLRLNYRNLKEGAAFLKCPSCKAIAFENPKKRVYLPCQRVELYVSDTAQEKGAIMSVWLQGGEIDGLQRGSLVSVVGFYDIHVCYSNEKGRMFGTMNEFIVGLNVIGGVQVNNRLFFSSMIAKFSVAAKRWPKHLSREYSNYDYIVDSWNLINECVQLFMTESIFTTSNFGLKLAMLLSIILINRVNLRPVIKYHSIKKVIFSNEIKDLNIIEDRINLFVITDEPNMIIRAMEKAVDGLEKVGMFPSVYDLDSLAEFLLSIHNGVLIVKDPHRLKKADIELIFKLSKGREININEKYGKLLINCAVWVIASQPLIKIKAKELERLKILRDYWPVEMGDIFDILIDTSYINNLAKGVRTTYDCKYTEKLLINMLQRYTNLPELAFDEGPLDLKPTLRSKLSPLILQPPPLTQTQSQYSPLARVPGNSEEVIDQAVLKQTIANNHKNALTLLKRFYVCSRRSKMINLFSLSSLRKIANACSILREMSLNYQNTYDANGEINLEIIDATIAIMLNEDTTLNKYGPDQVIFGAAVSRLLANAEESSDEDTEKEASSNSEEFLRLYKALLEFINRYDNAAQIDC